MNSNDDIEKKQKKLNEEKIESDELLEEEEYELVEEDDIEELPDDDEYELVEDDDAEEEIELEEDPLEDEEYELIENDDTKEDELELEEESLDEEYELVEDDDTEDELPEVEEVQDDEEYELIEDDDTEEDELELEEDSLNDEEYELVEEDDIDEELPEMEEVQDEEEYEVVEENDTEEVKETEEIELTEESEQNLEETTSEDEEEVVLEETTDSDEEDDSQEDIDAEYEEYYGDDGEEEEEEEPEPEEEEEEESIYPDELIDIELECIYIGLLFNNPRAISRFYLLYEDCHFSDNELTNLYKIVLFRDGEQFAPAQAKNKYQLPRETPNTYDLKMKVRRIAAAKNYELEEVYTKLKKLFILKKNYIVAATSAIQEKILEIQNYELYDDMTVEEVESALEQITVTTGLTQGRLNENVTDFLLAGDNELSAGLSIPFPILTTVFKGLRRGETMCYAMPSNSGKSRFTLNLAAYISFIHKEKVLIISNEMAEDKMKLCMITTILNNPEIQKLHGQEISVSETELLELKFRPDKGKRVKCDDKGYILRKEGESQEEYIEKLKKNSTVFRQTLKVTEWVNTQMNNSIFFIHITEHTNDDLKKIIMNYYYKEGIHYMFYDTLKADTANIGNSDEVKKTATILSNLAQKFRIFIASSMQLIESNTLPVNLTVNEMSASKTVKEVLDTLCLIKQISRATLNKYEYSDTDQFDVCHDIDVPRDTDVRFYACVVDKNRAGAKPTVLFRLNLAYNRWEELGHVRFKQTEDGAEIIDRA